jgi:hypothetical protein
MIRTNNNKTKKDALIFNLKNYQLKTKGMLEQSGLQNLSFVILKDQTTSLKPATMPLLNRKHTFLLPYSAFIKSNKHVI